MNAEMLKKLEDAEDAAWKNYNAVKTEMDAALEPILRKWSDLREQCACARRKLEISEQVEAEVKRRLEAAKS